MGLRRLLPVIAALGGAVLLAGCDAIAPASSDRPETALQFPAPDRPVAEVVSNQFSNEDAREGRNAFVEKRPAQFTGR